MKNQEKIGKNMLLVTGYWQNGDTFKLLPLTKECPYSEVIYDPNTTLLVVISKLAKPQFQMVPRLDDNGNKVRSTKPKQNGKDYKEQRTTIDVFTEYYIVEKKEQEAFVEMFAANTDTYDYKKYMKELEPQEMGASGPAGPDMILPETKIIDQSGKPLVKV